MNMKLKDRLILKKVRQKYRRFAPLQSRVARKSAEENLSCSLSILHDSHRDEEWAKRIKNLIRFGDEEIDLSL